jgi:hypothetical protein
MQVQMQSLIHSFIHGMKLHWVSQPAYYYAVVISDPCIYSCSVSELDLSFSINVVCIKEEEEGGCYLELLLAAPTPIHIDPADYSRAINLMQRLLLCFYIPCMPALPCACSSIHCHWSAC